MIYTGFQWVGVKKDWLNVFAEVMQGEDKNEVFLYLSKSSHFSHPVIVIQITENLGSH